MSEAAKWCPQCAWLNAVPDRKCRNEKCGFVFTGDELGAKVAPVVIDTESETLGHDAIRTRLLKLPDEPRTITGSRKEDQRVLLIGIGTGVGIATVSVAVLISSLLVSREFPESGSFTSLMILIGIVGSYIAIRKLMATVRSYLRVPKFASPEEVADCFYEELIGQGNVPRAWSCLDSTMRSQFDSLEGFRKYWETRQDEMKQWAISETKPLLAARPKEQEGTFKCDITLESVDISNTNSRTADLRSDIMVSAYESVEVRKDRAGNRRFVFVYWGRFVWPQSKTLLMGSDRWYLTSGTLDGPKPQQSSGNGN